MMTEIKILYDPRDRSIKIEDPSRVFKFYIIDLIRIFLSMNLLRDMFKTETTEKILLTKEHKNNPLDFIGLTKKKRKIPVSIRKELWRKYHNNSFSGQCYTCGIDIDAMEFRAAHVKADSKNGKLEVDNLRTCCKECDDSMHNMNLYTFILRERKDCPGRKNMREYFQQFPEEKNDRMCSFISSKAEDNICFLREHALSKCRSPDVWNFNKDQLIDIYYSLDEKELPKEREITFVTNNKCGSKTHIIDICHNKCDLSLPSKRYTPILNGAYFYHVLKNKRVIIATGDILEIRDLDGKKSLKKFVGHTGKVKCFTVIDDMKMIISGSGDKTLKLWDFDGNCLDTLTGHIRGINSINFFKGKIISEALNDLKVWDLSQRKCIYTISAGIDLLKQIIIFNGSKVIYPCVDKKLRIWDLESGELIFEYLEYSRVLTNLIACKDGNIILGAKPTKNNGEERIIFESDFKLKLLKDGRIGVI